MRLGFVYYESDNNNFKKNLIRYKTLLNKFFGNNDNSILKKLHETLNNLLKECVNYEILTQEESSVYNIIIESLTTSLNQEELIQVKNEVLTNDIKSKISQKISTTMPDVNFEIVKNIIEKSQSILKNSDSKNIEVVFIPDSIDINC